MSTGSSPLPDIFDAPSVNKPSNTNSIEAAELESTHSVSHDEYPNDELKEHSKNGEPELESPEWSKKSGFGTLVGSSTMPDIYDPQSVEMMNTDSEVDSILYTASQSGSSRAPDEVEELETKLEEHELAEEAADAEVEEIEEKKVTFEDRMRNTLRALGVEVEDDDDWKQMVIKTRLTLKDLKDSFINSESLTVRVTRSKFEVKRL